MSEEIDLRTFIPTTDVYREDSADTTPFTAEELTAIAALSTDERIALAAESYWRTYEQAYGDFPDQIPEILSITVTDDDGTRVVSIRRDRSIAG